MMTTASILERNPLLQLEGLPRYDEIAPEHVEPAVRHLLAQAERQLQALEANLEPTWDGLMEPLVEIERPFQHTWRPVVHLMNVCNSEGLRQAHAAVLGDVVDFQLRLGQSRPIYDGLNALKVGAQWAALSLTRQRVVALRLRDAAHAGVGLEGDERARFLEIARELSQLETAFENHVLDATQAFELIVEDPADGEGWPQTLKQLSAQSYNLANDTASATPEGGPWRITLDGPSLISFLQHARRPDQRKAVYLAFVTRAAAGDHDNTPLIDRILHLRCEKARLLGFDTFAEFSLDAKMAPDVDAIYRMYTELEPPARPHAERDVADLITLAGDAGFERWDAFFWSERLRERRFDFSGEDLRPYFPLPRVLDGLFALCQDLFGIKVERAQTPAPVWHPDVEFYHVRNEAGDPIASFYLDPYARPHEKHGGAWMDNCLSRRWIDGRLQLPVVHLMCNSIPPLGDQPSLMSFGEVLTLFHEFGHGLQGMLTTVDEPEVSGIRGLEWDAVEIASQFMENWCYHRPTLLGLTAHVDSGERLPDALYEKLRTARNFQAGLQMLRQLQLGMFDLQLHREFDPDGAQTPLDLYRRVAERMDPLPKREEDRALCAFTHVFGGGYAAGYYSYKWSEVLSADAFSAFEEAGLDDEVAVRALGRAFRDTFLALGGSRPAMDVFVQFRGRAPSTGPLLHHSGLV